MSVQSTKPVTNHLLARVRALKEVSRHAKTSTYKRRASKLDVHSDEIFSLHREGASLLEIQIALRAVLKPSVVCSRSTIDRYLKRDAPTLTTLDS